MTNILWQDRVDDEVWEQPKEENEMTEIFEHFHCANCGRVVLPDQGVYARGRNLCAKCFKQRDTASLRETHLDEIASEAHYEAQRDAWEKSQ